VGTVVQFAHPGASRTVIAKLVELGYLRKAKRHKARAVTKAIERLRTDLFNAGVLREGDLSRFPWAGNASLPALVQRN
jgi:hypothetical protein